MQGMNLIQILMVRKTIVNHHCFLCENIKASRIIISHNASDVIYDHSNKLKAESAKRNKIFFYHYP